MLDKSLEFLKFLRKFEEIKRTVYRPDGREENDAEHSYQIAMMAWFLSNEFDLKLSTEKLLKYGLVHDLVEVYAGDTPAYSADLQIHQSKKEREEKAFERITKEFTHFEELIETITAYEKKEDEESIFVYEIDKIIPALNLYMDDGYGWNKMGLTLEQIKKEKRSKVKNVKQLVDLLEETLERFEKEEGKLFTLKSV